MTETLAGKLVAYGETDMYPLHMPGHKRRVIPEELETVCRMDITEIEGFDNLHDARGVIREAQEYAARLYGSSETAFLVNGSSGGLLAAILSVCRPGSGILLSRGCHKAVYHALEIGNLFPRYLYPYINRKYGILEGISGEDVRKALSGSGECPDPGRSSGESLCSSADDQIRAVVITSPTFDGVVSDIQGICAAAHAKGIPVIVDEAHGAHLRFSSAFPQSALDAGADIVVQSCHKTLPALTQSSLLHVNGDLVDRNRLHKMLGVFQTSSPSYLLMGSIDGCMHLLEEEGKQLFESYVSRLETLRRGLKEMQYLHLFAPEDLEYPGSCGYDPSKLVISCRGTGKSGDWLYRLLLEKYHIQLEMESSDYVLGITTVGDDAEGLSRVREAFLAADRAVGADIVKTGKDRKVYRAEASEDTLGLQGCYNGKKFPMLPVLKAALPIGEASWRKTQIVSLQEAEGRICADYIYLYPPGIPLVTPGEILSGQAAERIQEWRCAGLEVSGVLDGRVRVIQ